MKAVVMFIMFLQAVYGGDVFYYKENKKVILTPMKIESRSLSSTDFYQNPRGIVLGVQDTLIVKFHDIYNLEEIVSKFALELVSKLGKDTYLFKVASKSITIDTSNRLTQESYVEYAHPNFIKKSISR